MAAAPAFGIADVGAAMMQKQQDAQTAQLLGTSGQPSAPSQPPPPVPPPPATSSMQQDQATRRLLGEAEKTERHRALSREAESRRDAKDVPETSCFRMVLNGEIESAELGAGNHGLLSLLAVQFLSHHPFPLGVEVVAFEKLSGTSL
eukprot:TRINITY_DN27766_c0_g1_i2.p1 TRINITY_DN27766_c0_g1~~TRINITY_DN27766_c0_g1_i2.p1  ORF type:complete len:159 (-),score=51.67 TRINITY_DN27766_c0_g1_i2:435-875(-)